MGDKPKWKNIDLLTISERTEREKISRCIMETVHGAFELGYQAGVADTLKQKEKKK